MRITFSHVFSVSSVLLITLLSLVLSACTLNFSDKTLMLKNETGSMYAGAWDDDNERLYFTVCQSRVSQEDPSVMLEGLTKFIVHEPKHKTLSGFKDWSSSSTQCPTGDSVMHLAYELAVKEWDPVKERVESNSLRVESNSVVKLHQVPTGTFSITIGESGEVVGLVWSNEDMVFEYFIIENGTKLFPINKNIDLRLAMYRDRDGEPLRHKSPGEFFDFSKGKIDGCAIVSGDLKGCNGFKHKNKNVN